MLITINFLSYVIFSIQIHQITCNPPNPNIILIIVDDLRPALECYNDTKSITPNINKLAKNSFIFTNAHSQQALCAPSRNSMLTSRRPDTLKLYDFNSYWRTDIPGNFTTLPQHLKANGYSTYSIGKIFHPGLTSNFTDDFPYSWSEPTYHPSTEIYMNRPTCPDKRTGNLEKNVICPVQVRFQPFGTLPDIQSITKAKQFLNSKISSGSPYFLAIGLHKPHIPFRFPVKYLKKHKLTKFINPEFNYIPFDLPTVAFNPYMDIRSRSDAKQQNISYPFGPIPHEFGIRMRQAYYSTVTYIDDLIGKLLSSSSIQWNNTIIILTSDHGWSLGEHAEWAKYSNYDSVTRVPLLIYLPPSVIQSKKQPFDMSRKIDQPVELLDIFPTIVELVKIKSIPKCNEKLIDNNEQCVEGKSLVKYLLLTNETTITSKIDDYEYAFSQYPRPSNYPTVFSDRPTRKQIKIMGYSIRSKYFRYTAWIGFDSDKIKRDWQNVYGEELYDHRIDRHENMNLVDRPELNIIKFMLKDRLQYQFP